MMFARSCLSLLACLLAVGTLAADPPQSFWQRWCQPACPSIGGCPDDYCRKPLPCVPRVPCGGPDDYCRKPLPTLLCPPASPNLQCGSCGPK